MAESLKQYVDYLLENKIDEVTGSKLINDCKDLSSFDKKLIYAYVYPRLLRDGELPSRVQNFRKENNLPLVGQLQASEESILLVEAERTGQYCKFIHHLVYSFSNPKNIFPVEGTGKSSCPICGKILYEKDLWDELIKQDPNSPEVNRREYLAFGSPNSSVSLCADCLAQLIYADELLESINPDYLYYRKRSNNNNQVVWNDLKL